MTPSLIMRYCNLQNSKKISLNLSSLKPDIIINLAAEANFFKKKKSMFKINAICPTIFAKYCKKNDKYLIQASGTLVHKKSEIYSHKSKFNPDTYYGMTKLYAEKKIIKSSCKYAIIRFAGIFGKNGPNHLGLNKTISDAIRGRILKFSGNTKIKRNYIYVGDAANVIKKCLDNSLNGIFYASGQIQSFGEMLRKINKNLGKNYPINFTNKKNNDMNQLSICSSNFNFRSFTACLKDIKNN